MDKLTEAIEDCRFIKADGLSYLQFDEEEKAQAFITAARTLQKIVAAMPDPGGYNDDSVSTCTNIEFILRGAGYIE